MLAWSARHVSASRALVQVPAVCVCRKGPAQLELTTNFDHQTALFERIVKKAGGEPLTPQSFVSAVELLEHLEFGAWLSHVFPSKRKSGK